MPRSNALLMVLASVLMLTALTLGGSTRPGYVSDIVLQLLACPILLILAWRVLAGPASPEAPSRRGAILFTLAVLALPLLQLIPVSPSLEPAAAAEVSDGIKLVSPSGGWRPLSVAPEATWLAWLSLLPPFALFWAVANLERPKRRLLCGLLILVAVVSVPLAFLQLAGGPNSDLRFYEYTNRDEAVGFFANRNHFAAFLYCATLFVGGGALALLSEYGTLTQKRDQSATIFAVALAFCLVAALTVVQAMARSRAGVLLQGLALISLIAVAPPALILGQAKSNVRKAMIVAALVAAAVLGQLVLFRFLDRFASESLADDARLKFLANTVTAARAYMPFGAGFGSFVRIYGSFEKPSDALAGRFANHAHNDWAELWLETGAAGVALAAVFVVWLAVRALRPAVRPDEREAPVDQFMRRLGWVALVLVLLHSIVDYPLRTEAIMAVFAFSAGLQMLPPPSTRTAREGKPLASMFKRRRRSAEAIPVVVSSHAPFEADQPDAPRSVQAMGDKKWEAATPWPSQWGAGQAAPAASPSKAAPAEPPTALQWPGTPVKGGETGGSGSTDG